MISKRKLLSLILSLSMAIGSFAALPMAASADEDAENPTVSLMDGDDTDSSGTDEDADANTGEDADSDADDETTEDGDSSGEDDSSDGTTDDSSDGTTVERSYKTLYSQDYEAEGATADFTTSSAGRYDPMLKSDNTNTWLGVNMVNRYNNGATLTSPTYSSYVSSYTSTGYAVEFDAALGYTNGDQTPTFSVNTSDGSLLTLTPSSSTTWTVNGYEGHSLTFATSGYTNDVSSADVASTSTWYHYIIIYDGEFTHLTVLDMEGNTVFGPTIIVSKTSTGALTTITYATARYYANFEIDNILIRTLDDYDSNYKGEQEEEFATSAAFTSELGTVISAPGEGESVHKTIAVKVTGNYGNDLTENSTIAWSVVGIDGEDGYISLTSDEVEATSGTAPTTTDKTVYFNVINGVSNWFGMVKAEVTCGEKSFTLTTPFAVIGASESTNIAPEAGYPVDMSDYNDSLVGYSATANGLEDQDIVLNNWSIYGSNGSRTLTLEQDDDGTKYLSFAANGGGNSTVGVYQLTDQSSQYIVDMTVRFTGGGADFGHYATTPNNKTSNAAWSASYSGGTLTIGTETISGLNSTDWFRILLSADESTDTLWAQVYKADGTLVGSTETTLLSTATESQKYFCIYGASNTVDLASFMIYAPTASEISVNSTTDTISVPTGEVPTVVSLDNDGALSYSTETKALTVTMADTETADLITAEYTDGVLSSVDITPLTFADGVATVEDYPVSETAKVYLWNSVEEMEPLTGTGVYEEPEAELTATADLSAIVKDLNGYDVTGEVTWEIDIDDENIVLDTTDSQSATLTVSVGAPAATVTVTARCGTVYVEKQIALTTTGNSITFSKSTSSMTIPFSGEDAVTAQFEAYTVNKSGVKTEYAVDDDGNATADAATITYTVLDKNSTDITNSMPTGVTFTDGVLTVTSEASPTVIYIKATNNDVTPLSRTVMVTIHGLSFAFGTDTPADTSYTQVTTDAYSEKLGYGFADASVITPNASNVTGSSDYRFKVTVPNGNYKVTVSTSSETVTSEVVESVSATTGISKTGGENSSFSVAVCDGVLDLTFASDSTLSSISITQADTKDANEKPYVYAIGDSTTNNTNNGACSWGNYVTSNTNIIPSTFGGFSNNGMAGRDSVNFYNQGRVETVLLNICPGDYVTVNMGINSTESGESSAYYTLMSEYYVQAIIDRGAIPVIVTATPIGYNSDPSKGWTENEDGTLDCDRGTGARNGVLRQIAEEKDLNIIELGYYFEDYFNEILTGDDYTSFYTTYNSENGTEYTSNLEVLRSWYVDHNHYKADLGELIAEYILESVETIATEEENSTDFYWEKDEHINER